MAHQMRNEMQLLDQEIRHFDRGKIHLIDLVGTVEINLETPAKEHLHDTHKEVKTMGVRVKI